jgi:hypothetical protein
MAHDVFLSYSSQDKPIADAVCGTLEGKRIRCWIATRDVLPGVPYGEAIVEAIEASRVMVLVFSSNSNKSAQVMREVERAVSKGIPIIPLRTEQVPPSKSLEYFISAPHWLDALTPPLEKHLQSLAETVHLLLSRHGKRCDSHEGETGASPGTVEEVAGKPDPTPVAKKPGAPAMPQAKRFPPTARAITSAMSKKPSGRPQATPPPLPVIQDTMKTAHPKLSRKWLTGSLAVVLLLAGLLGMWASGVFTGKPPEGTLVLENLPAASEVIVDGEMVKVSWQNGGKKAEIRVPPGTRKVELKNEGITVYGEEVEITEGKVRVLTVALKSTNPIPKEGKENKDDKWIQPVADQPAESQVKAVIDQLKERNPGFDGAVKPTIENGVVTGLEFVTNQVTDIRPLRSLPGLNSLVCRGSGGQGILRDLSPLKGMSLTTLSCAYNQISDLSPLEGMPLESLICSVNPVSDLSPLKSMHLKELHILGWKGKDLLPLKGMALTVLNCGESKVEDLSPLAGMPLNSLCLNLTNVSDLSPLKDVPLLNDLRVVNTRVSDLTPLKGMRLSVLFVAGSRVTDLRPIRELPLTDLTCDFRPERDTEILRSIKTLKTINREPVARFWK